MKKQSPLEQFTGSLTPFAVCTPVQSLVSLDPRSPWSHEILSHTTLREYSPRRRQLVSRLNHLFESVPHVQMDFGEALARNLIQESELASVYTLLINILNEEEYSERLLLYFPIELIPGADWNMSPAFINVADDFVEVYVRAWHILLLRQDIRANFVDGDIPETEIRTGPLPKVVKAAHLIPALIRKGILSYEDTCAMMEECSSNVLRESIEEILPLCTTPISVRESNTPSRDLSWLTVHISKNADDLKSLRRSHLADSAGKPRKRVSWEIARDEARSLDSCASKIAQALTNGTLDFKQFKDFLTQATDSHTILVGVTSLQKSFDSIAQMDIQRARSVYIEYEPLIDRLWRAGVLPIQERIEILWSHLLAVNIVEDTYLEERGVTTAQLEEVAKLRQDVQDVATGIARVIQESAELSAFMMPVAIVCGSQAKGYGTTETDIAAFIRPRIGLSQRDHIQKLLANHLKSIGITNTVFEFWLEETDNGLKIRDFPNPDRSLGDSLLVQNLFGGIWFGNHSSIRELYATVLASYLDRTDKLIQNQPLREFWLEEMERDTLQYRLMHKGYQRFYPERRTSCIPEAMVDSSGAFWDSGYRRLATKLFLKKVFLPYLPSTQK